MSLEEPLIRELEANFDSSSDEESDQLPCEWETVNVELFYYYYYYFLV